jgi:hypothetical protein
VTAWYSELSDGIFQCIHVQETYHSVLVTDSYFLISCFSYF